MKYDFTTFVDRSGLNTVAVDGFRGLDGFPPDYPEKCFEPLPMWIADMSFATAPSVLKALADRAARPSFGYFSASSEYFDAIIRWQRDRHGVELREEQIGYENGVLGALSSALHAFTAPGDGILVHSPTYVGFSRVLSSIGRRAVPSPLKKDADGIWRMDFADMEEKIKENRVHFVIFCSPHNPTGRVWERGEVEDFMALCKKYDLIVFSDGIWNDILLDGHKYVATHAVSDDARMRTVSVCAPSKTFSLAGLVGSYHFVFNETLHDKLKKASESTHYNNRNVLSDAALIGAYSPEGAAWADELCAVLSANAEYAYRHITEKYPGVSLARPQGTYMLYPDLTAYLQRTGRSLADVLAAGWRVGVIWQNGTPFGLENTIRINLALPTEKVKEAFERLDKYVFFE